MSDPDAKSNAVENSKPSRRWRRGVLWAGGGLLVLAVALELYARFYLGLGDPPLWMPDPKIEYLFQPHQDGWRFGKHYRYNAWSMRSDDFSKEKSVPNELRILVVGDSVVNGGNLTDQKDLATTLLSEELRARLKRPVVVGNISAGSWGPPNQLAYLQRFGLFQADVVVIVLSSHDAADVPTFAPLDENSPTRKPVLALEEFLLKFLPRLRIFHPDFDPSPVFETMGPLDSRKVEQSLEALRGMVELVRENGALPVLVQHWEVKELNTGSLEGYELIRAQARVLRLPGVSDEAALREAVRGGEMPYRDHIHPSERGQRALKDVIIAALEQHWPVMQGD